MFENFSVKALVFVLILVTVVMAGCGGGGSTASQDEIAQAEKHARRVKSEKEKERRLERKLATLERENRQAKKRRRQKARDQQKAIADAHEDPAPVESTPEAPSTPSGTDCGDGVIAGPETSCGFALNTRSAYEAEIGAGSGTVEAYSEANEEIYSMYCTEGSEHECSGAISATVYWP